MDPSNVGPGETPMDKVFYIDTSAQYSMKASLPLVLRQPTTLSWKNVPTLDVKGSGVQTTPIAVFRSGNNTIQFEFDAMGILKCAGVSIGQGGSPISKHLSATTNWNPPIVSNDLTVWTTIPVPGAAVGDTVAVGFSTPIPGGALLAGAVTAKDTVTVTLLNNTGADLDLVPGTLRADVWQH